MLRTLDYFKLVIVISSLFALVVQAQEAVPAADEREAQSWLRRIQIAAQTLNYSGTFIYQQGNRIRASRITHLLDGKNEIEKLEVLDGSPHEYIRRNEEIIYYAPQSKTLWVEQRIAKDTFPAILAAAPADLVPYYAMRKGETGRVAGNECQAVILQPKDKLRYGYKLWAEKDSGLLLRAQVIDSEGNMIEQIAFVQIEIGGINPILVKPTYPNTRGWRMENAVMRQADLSGWTVGYLPPGFRKIAAMKRLLSNSVADEAAGEAAQAASHARQSEIVQIVFSDGLAAISVFIEPGVQSRTEGFVQQGAMNIIGKRLGEFWLTIVGEVPATVIRQVANSIELKK